MGDYGRRFPSEESGGDGKPSGPNPRLRRSVENKAPLFRTIEKGDRVRLIKELSARPARSNADAARASQILAGQQHYRRPNRLPHESAILQARRFHG